MSTIYVDLIEDEPLTLRQFCVSNGFTEGTESADSAYQYYRDRFQPWRLLIKSGDNQKPLFRTTESYFNKADAVHAAEIGFGAGSNVYLRQHEKGNEALRMATE